MSIGSLIRFAHRVHRSVGSQLSLLLTVWFASGAVMLFSGYPRYSDEERLRAAAPLPAAQSLSIPPMLRDHLAGSGLSNGARVRLAMFEDRAVWRFDRSTEDRVALHAVREDAFLQTTPGQMAAALARRAGHPVKRAILLEESDQWTVALASRSLLPLLHLELDDAAGTEFYMSMRTGEVVQQTTRKERTLAWLGAIPHWIYPTVLRRERELWRHTVLVLSFIGLVVSVSGSIAGFHAWRQTRKRGIRDPYLRWHHAIGLWFGLFVSTWLLSGALSLHPFQWSGSRASRPREQRVLYAARVPRAEDVIMALEQCQRRMSVSELEVGALGTRAYAVCSASDGMTRLIDLSEPSRSVRERMPDAALHELLQELAPSRLGVTEVQVMHEYDAYHYPTHTRPAAALPYARLCLGDAAGTVFYVDPQRARLLRRHDARTRLERWLYQGLHSFDLPGLYERRWLWRAGMIASMVVGCLLAGLGLGMTIRRTLRKSRKRQASPLSR